MLAYCGDEYYHNGQGGSSFRIGVKWDEESIGTNGVTLALRLRKPVQVYGAEHYCRFQQDGTCSAAPIFGEDGAVLGIINMAGKNTTGSLHTMGLVALGAFSVEKQLGLAHSYQLLDDTFATIFEGLIALHQPGQPERHADVSSPGGNAAEDVLFKASRFPGAGV